MSGRRRRKSLSIFRPSLTSLTPISDMVPESAPPATMKRQRRPSSFFTPSRSTSPSSPTLERTNSANSLGSGRPPSPKSRPRTLQKAARPSSIFGSFRSLHSVQDDDDSLVRMNSKHSSLGEDITGYLDVANMSVLHHGEVQTTGGVFRKKKEYVVLTNSHLVRFKNQSKASIIPKYSCNTRKKYLSSSLEDEFYWITFGTPDAP